ncbi:hypothetical protein ACQEVB_29360 [Pseudonocardia sp. CA-107938]|uniref:hypothetical protein n=1 Tax=Pseudonocardia sp. CA-107938 TaxID=3240021 RepID=UPI003D93859E
MSAVTPEPAPEVDDRTDAAAPCLVAAPWAGPIVSLLFIATVVLFVLGVLALGPLG